MDINQKPTTMPLIDFFIKKTAVKTLVSENVADLIIKDQWRSLNKLIKDEIYVEVSGLGYFKMSRNMVSKQIDKLEKMIPRTEAKAERTKQEGKRVYGFNMAQTMREELTNYKRKLAKYENRFPRTTTRNLQQTFGREMGKENSISEI